MRALALACLAVTLCATARDGTYIEGWEATDRPYFPPETFVASYHNLSLVKQMKYRKLPGFGLVSVIGLSASRLGDSSARGAGGIRYWCPLTPSAGLGGFETNFPPFLFLNKRVCVGDGRPNGPC